LQTAVVLGWDKIALTSSTFSSCTALMKTNGKEQAWNQLRLKQIMSTETSKKKDPYALRFKEFNIFITSFCYGFAWSMQFIVIEWQVYSITKDPLSLKV
jgi:hypothetical protein